MQNGNDARTNQIEKRIDPEISGAIALSGTGGALSIAPQNMAEMFEFAKMMAVSGPCVRPAFRGSPGACLAIALQAFRTGADPFAVANKAYITTNRAGDEQIAYEAQYIHAVLNTSGKLTKRLRPIYSGEGESRKCTIIGYIVGEDEPLDYESPTVGEIPVKNSPLWKGDPDQQLFYYSSRAWGRRHLPEVLLGMYTSEEIHGEIIDMTPAPPPPRREEFMTAPGEHNEPDEHTSEPEPKGFDVADEVGDIITHPTAAAAYFALLAAFATARTRTALKAVGENNAAVVEDIGKSIEGAAASLRLAYAESLQSFVTREEVRSDIGSIPQRERRDNAPPPVKEEESAGGATPVETTRAEGNSLAVPIRPGPRQGTSDWAGTAEDMVAVIADITDPADTAPGGGFNRENSKTLELMRAADKEARRKVQYALSIRDDKLRQGAA